MIELGLPKRRAVGATGLQDHFRTLVSTAEAANDALALPDLRIGMGTTMIEPAYTGGHLDGIGVYTRALLRHLPRAGCALLPYSWPRLRGGGAITAGEPLPHARNVAARGRTVNRELTPMPLRVANLCLRSNIAGTFDR